MPQQQIRPSTVYPSCDELLPSEEIREGAYVVRYASTEEELDELLKLRFEVFNLELGEGLDASYETGRDRDEFDNLCHHLTVVEQVSGAIIATYRIQTSSMAERHIGFYSDAEFDLSRLPAPVLADSVEVGRACIAPAQRNTTVLFLLFKGLALYMASNRKRYLFGCCSLTSQDPEEGWALMDHLEQQGHLHPEMRTAARPDFECRRGDPAVVPPPRSPQGDEVRGPRDEGLEGGTAAGHRPVKIPQLFRIYLRHGAKVCGPPAIDRRFKTIDYLVVFDVAAMDERRFRTFFG